MVPPLTPLSYKSVPLIAIPLKRVSYTRYATVADRLKRTPNLPKRGVRIVFPRMVTQPNPQTSNPTPTMRAAKRSHEPIMKLIANTTVEARVSRTVTLCSHHTGSSTGSVKTVGPSVRTQEVLPLRDGCPRAHVDAPSPGAPSHSRNLRKSHHTSLFARSLTLLTGGQRTSSRASGADTYNPAIAPAMIVCKKRGLWRGR